MENSGILNWRRWSVIRKVQIIGVVLGGLGTAAFNMAASVINDPHTGGMLDLGGAVQLLICLPTYLFLKLIGMESTLVVDGDRWPLTPFLLMAFINAVLLFIIGTGLGWIINAFINRKNNSNK